MNRRLPFEFGFDDCGRLRRPLRVVLRIRRVNWRKSDSNVAQMLEEKVMIGMPAELAVGDDIETDTFLERDRVFDRSILRRPQFFIFNLSRLKSPP